MNDPFEDFEESLTKQVKESTTAYDLEVEGLIEREQRWKAKRIENITSSNLDDLMPEKKDGTIKTKKGLDYLLEIKHQRDTGVGSEQTFAKSINWGNEHEHEAHLYFKRGMSEMMSGTFDFDEILFVDGVLDGFGDSPDGCTEDHSAVAEYKCPYSGAAHLRNLALDSYTENEDYYWQCIGHMIDPRVKVCYFVSFDPRYPDGHPDKMKALTIKREDVLADIERAKVKIMGFNEVIGNGGVKGILKL